MSKTQVLKIKPRDFEAHVEVAAIYLQVQGKILLLRLSAMEEEAGKWGVPGGKIEADEAIDDAARRELHEETGIFIETDQTIESLGCLFMRKPDLDYIYHAFRCSLEKTPRIVLSQEHDDFCWATVEEALQMDLMNGAIDALNAYRKGHD